MPTHRKHLAFIHYINLQDSYDYFTNKSAGAVGKGTLILSSKSDAVLPRSTVKKATYPISSNYNGVQPGFTWEDKLSSCRSLPSRS